MKIGGVALLKEIFYLIDFLKKIKILIKISWKQVQRKVSLNKTCKAEPCRNQQSWFLISC